MPRNGDGEERGRGLGLNQVTLLGRLTADPQLRYSPDGKVAITEFRLVTNDRREPEFHHLVAYRQLGEAVAQYQRKGSLVLVAGHLHTDRWTGTDGSPRSRVVVIAENVQFLGSKPQQDEEAQS
jgi:single-strand DNA-binding protein